MKKIFYIFFGLSLLSSCTNLEETIYTDLSKENFFINEESLSKYSARVYASLQDWATEQSYWTFDIQVSDEVCVPHNPAGSWEDGGRYRQLQTHDIPNTNKLLLKAWNFCFNGISACNDVLDVFESVKKDFPGKDRVIAEVKVMRAYFYFCAICYWKDVPFAISKDLTSYPDKKDRAFVFNFIEQELKDNIDPEAKRIYSTAPARKFSNTTPSIPRATIIPLSSICPPFRLTFVSLWASTQKPGTGFADSPILSPRMKRETYARARPGCSGRCTTLTATL